MALKTGKPRVQLFIGGTGLACEIDSPQGHCAGSSSAANDVLHHVGHDEGIALIDNPLRAFSDRNRTGFSQHRTLCIFDALDKVRAGAETAVCKHSVAHHHLQRRR